MFSSKPKFITSKDIYDSVEKLGKISKKIEIESKKKVDKDIVNSIIETIEEIEVEKNIENIIDNFNPLIFSSNKKKELKKEINSEYAGSDIIWLK